MKKFFKQSIWIIMWLLVFGWVFAAWLVQRNNSRLELSQLRMLFTNDGTIWWTEVFDINSGGNIIAYWPLVDWAMNPFLTGVSLSGYITGYTETDPIWNAISGDYVPYTGATTDVYLWGNSIYANNAYLQFGGMWVVRTAGGLRAALGGIWEGTFYVANTNTGVILDVNQLTQDRTISFPDATGTIMLDTTMSWYVPRTNIDTGFNNTWSDTIIPSEKAVYDYVSNLPSEWRLTSGNIWTTGMVLWTTNDYELQFIISWQNAWYMDAIWWHRNIFLWWDAWNGISTAENNIGIWLGAMVNNSQWHRNICIWMFCMQMMINWTNNTCAWVYCMQNVVSWKWNTSLWDESLQYNEVWNFNTAIGMSAWNSQTWWDYNVYLWQGADSTWSNISYSSAIWYHAEVRTSHMMQLWDTTLTRLTTRAKFGIGVIDPKYALDVSWAIASHSLILSDVAGVSCATTWQIIFSWSNFLGCDGANRKQLDN